MNNLEEDELDDINNLKDNYIFDNQHHKGNVIAQSIVKKMDNEGVYNINGNFHKSINGEQLSMSNIDIDTNTNQTSISKNEHYYISSHFSSPENQKNEYENNDDVLNIGHLKNEKNENLHADCFYENTHFDHRFGFFI